MVLVNASASASDSDSDSGSANDSDGASGGDVERYDGPEAVAGDADADADAYRSLVAERYHDLRSELERLGHGSVAVIGVTKGHGVSAPLAARAAGIVDLGENYAQELLAKAPDVPSARWHFIGQLQRRKVRAVAPLVSLWQSVDRPELVAEVARRAPGASILLQVNISGEPSRGGADPNEIEALLTAAEAAGLDVRGLMGVASNADVERVEFEFRSLVRLADTLGLAERCIGMSGDYRIAIECGSTMIRIGQRLFGERPPRP
jgi:pyridoxal phosphate enzyme (YggS family)